MMRQHMEDAEIFERYARNQLAPAERKAFEEHFFACDECFEKLQAAERFIAGVRDAARSGKLDGGLPGATPARRWGSWLFPAFAVSACAALGFAVVAGWTFLFHLPKLREEMNQTAAELRTQQEARAALEQQMERAGQPEGNVPLVVLQATRAAQAPQSEIALPAEAQHLVLWIEVGPGRYRSFRLQVDAADHQPVETLEHLERNAYGALAVSLPADRLQPGDYRIRLTGEEPPPLSLLAEYRLRIRRPQSKPPLS